MTAPLAATPFSITDPLPTGTVLLEASAGTGKTWTIAALVTRWVAEGLVTLPEMLIVTFGRAASHHAFQRGIAGLGFMLVGSSDWVVGIKDRCARASFVRESIFVECGFEPGQECW